MQSGVIDGILSVEDEAEEIIENAQKEASSIIAAANDKAAKLVSQSFEEARKRGQSDVDAAEALLASHLAMYEEERARILSGDKHVDPEVLDRAAERIVNRILSTGVQDE